MIRAALALSANPFSAVQTTWNLLEPSAGPALAEAHDAGWLVVVKEALANGRLVSRMNVALDVAARQPWADIVLSGAVTPSQLRENLQAATTGPPGRVSWDVAALAEMPEQYWAERSARPWQ